MPILKWKPKLNFKVSSGLKKSEPEPVYSAKHEIEKVYQSKNEVKHHQPQAHSQNNHSHQHQNQLDQQSNCK